MLLKYGNERSFKIIIYNILLLCLNDYDVGRHFYLQFVSCLFHHLSVNITYSMFKTNKLYLVFNCSIHIQQGFMYEQNRQQMALGSSA
jgi:hypothetical protein